MTRQVISEEENSDPAKSPLGEFELPSGFVDQDGVIQKKFILREMTGKEEDILGSETIDGQKKIDLIVKSCVQSIGEKKLTGTEKDKIIDGLPQVDFIFIYVALRRLTFGDQYQFKVKCPCEKQIAHKPIQNLAELVFTPVKNVNPRTHAIRLPKSEKNAVIKWISNSEGNALSARKNSDSPVTSNILAHLVELDGKFELTIEDIRSLSVIDTKFIRTEINKLGGDYESTTTVACMECGKDFDVGLNLAEADFFYPPEM